MTLSVAGDRARNKRMQKTFEEIRYHDELLALIATRHFQQPGVRFFTGDASPQQLGYMRLPPGKVIQPHVHNPVIRQVNQTQEVLFIKKGRLRVDLYSGEREYACSRILEAGDVVLLVGGGHGFEALEEVEMFEVKQGPYAGEQDKTRFAAVSPNRIVLP
jgi:mannose-6-phosphate isomerase-like protein (cupin superfamily)